MAVLLQGLGMMAQQSEFDMDSIVAGRVFSGRNWYLTSLVLPRDASVDRNGNIFFTDQPNNKIWEYTLDGELVLFMDSAGRSRWDVFRQGWKVGDLCR